MVESIGMQTSSIYRDPDTGRLRVDTTAGSLDSKGIMAAEQVKGEERLKPYQDKIDIKNKETAALAELKERTSKFKETLRFLDNGSAGQEGLFDYVEASYRGLNDKAAEKFFTLEPKLRAHEQTFDLNIVKLAERDSAKGSAKFTDMVNPAGLIGTITFNHVDPEKDPIVITLDGTENPQDIANKFNTVQKDTRVWAKINPAGTLSLTSLDFVAPLIYEANITSGNANFLPESRTKVTAGNEIPDGDTETSLGISGSLTFKNIDSESPDIVINCTDNPTASGIIHAINTASDNTGIVATLENNKIVFTSSDNKTPPEFTSDLTGNTNYLPQTSEHTKQSLKAVIEYDGDTFYSDRNNEISDIPEIDKITLFAPTPNTVGVTLALSDKKRVEAMENFVTEFNAMKKITHKYTTMDIDSLDLTEEEQKDFKLGLLRRDKSMAEMQTMLSDMTTKVVNGMSLATMGIKLNEKGVLELDTPMFLKEAHKNTEAVKAFFGYGETSSDSLLSTSMHPDSIPPELIATDVTIDLSKGLDGVYVATLDYDGNTGDPITLEVIEEAGRFLSLKAPADSIIEGFTFFYGRVLADGDVVPPATMQFTQGIAETGVKKIHKALSEKGTFSESLKLIDRVKIDLETRVDRIDTLNKKKKEELEKQIQIKSRMIKEINDSIRQMREMNKALMASSG